MAHSKFSLHGPAFEVCTRTMIQPVHIMVLQGEDEDMDAAQIFQPPLGVPAPQEERGEQSAHSTENLLNCILGDDCDLHAFQEYEGYYYGGNSGSDDCDVPEDDFSDDETMEDISIEKNQPIPITLPEEDNPAEGDQQSPGNLQVEDNLIEGVQPSPVNLQGEDNATEWDQPNPGNLQVEDKLMEGDQPSPVYLPEEENPTEGDQPSSVNLQVTLVNLQVTAEDSSTPRQLAVSVETFEGVYSEADQEKIPRIHMDVQGLVQTVITTSAEEGESSCSSWILKDNQEDQKTEPDTYELLSEAMKESSEKGVNEASLVDLIEPGAPDN